MTYEQGSRKKDLSTGYCSRHKPFAPNFSEFVRLIGPVEWSTLSTSSFTINIKAARDFCPDVICRHLNVYCNCGLLSIALGSEDTYVDLSK